MEQAVGRKKVFLLSVSVVESFTARQAAIMGGLDALSESCGQFLMYREFIRERPDQNPSIIRSILRDYLQNRFCHDWRKEVQGGIFRRAGLAYAAIGQYCSAVHFFTGSGILTPL